MRNKICLFFCVWVQDWILLVQCIVSQTHVVNGSTVSDCVGSMWLKNAMGQLDLRVKLVAILNSLLVKQIQALWLRNFFSHTTEKRTINYLDQGLVNSTSAWSLDLSHQQGHWCYSCSIWLLTVGCWPAIPVQEFAVWVSVWCTLLWMVASFKACEFQIWHWKWRSNLLDR